MPRLTHLLAAFAVITLPAPAGAWGKTGHRAIAAIAATQLSGLARAQIHALMGEEGLVEASTRPDEMRADPAPFWQKTAAPWHYVTLNGILYDQPPSEGDALTALANYRSVLRDPAASLGDKQLALRFIAHLVGDLHQPLHSGKCCDRGGNDVPVRWFGKTTNLHAVWDSQIIDDEQYSFSELAQLLERHISDADVARWWDINPRDWVSESAQIRDSLYPAGGTAKRPAALGYDYAYRWTPTVHRRLSMAGVRLAAYLNDIYASPVLAGAQ